MVDMAKKHVTANSKIYGETLFERDLNVETLTYIINVN